MAPHENGNPGSPLDGVRVIDLSRYIAGPHCSQMLGDMGAEVIKIERPAGEEVRAYRPHYKGHGLYPTVYNRNKYGITLNTRHPKAIALLARLIESADVVVENYRPGTMESIGLGWDRIHEINSRAILTSISGFGQTGPNADRALFDSIAQAEAGLMSLTGMPDEPPRLTGTFIADYVAAFHGVIGTLLALIARERTGEGQLVDVASVDALFTCLGTRPTVFAMLGLLPQRRGNTDEFTTPANLYEAKDGFVYVHAGLDSLFARLVFAMGQPELAEDPRFVGVKERREHAAELDELIRAWTSQRRCDEVIDALRIEGVPVGRVASMKDITGSPQIAAREMILDVEHPVIGTLKLPGFPIKLSATPATVRKPPPLLGEDNNFVYQDLLGLDRAEVELLRNEGAI